MFFISYQGWIYYNYFRFYHHPESVDFEKSTIYHYLKTRDVFVCPSISSDAQVTYAVNSDASYAHDSMVKKPSATPLILEEECNSDNRKYGTDDGAFYVGTRDEANELVKVHNNRAVFSFFDGHVTSEKMENTDCWQSCDFRHPFVTWQ